MTLGDIRHLLTHDAANFTADIGIHFIKNQQWHIINFCQHCLEGQHHTGQLATRSDSMQREGCLADVGREKEFHPDIALRS